MNITPTLETARLKLRPYRETDIPDLLHLIGTREVAATTLRIPHPYTEQDAKQFIAMCQEQSTQGESGREESSQDECRFWLAITLRVDGSLLGGVGLRLDSKHRHAELGYWLGVPYWGKGFATEAAREMLRYGFEDLQLHRIFASHFKHNPASGRILAKLGMRYEGCQREHLLKWDRFIDSELYGILRQEWRPGEYNA